MWARCWGFVRRNHYIIPVLGLLTLATQIGCPPDPGWRRTKTIPLPEAVQIEPVIIEHVTVLRTQDSWSGKESTRFDTPSYTLTTTDGRQIELRVRNEHPVVRELYGKEREFGWSAEWSQPEPLDWRRDPLSRSRQAATRGDEP